MLGDKANTTRNFKNMVSNSLTVLLINCYIVIKLLIQSSNFHSSFRNTGRHFKNNAFCPSFTFICHLNTDFFPHRGKKKKVYHCFQHAVKDVFIVIPGDVYAISSPWRDDIPTLLIQAEWSRLWWHYPPPTYNFTLYQQRDKRNLKN